MTMLNIDVIHPSWQPIVKTALKTLDTSYLTRLEKNDDWLPGPQHIFRAFSLPLNKTRYILFGESPYPRVESANGYAFWDANVKALWSETGLSKTVNRATSLRNLLKMLLFASGSLSDNDMSQAAIAAVPKENLLATLHELFTKLLDQGFLLLNASLVLSEQAVKQEAKQWQRFMGSLLTQLQEQKQDIQLILFGKIAEAINRFPAAKQFPQLIAEHPYNLSFIKNPDILTFFRPLELLKAT